jgi:hypothetical protein
LLVLRPQPALAAISLLLPQLVMSVAACMWAALMRTPSIFLLRVLSVVLVPMLPSLHARVFSLRLKKQ